MNGDQQKRYTAVAIWLHWVMAVGFFLMLGSGLVMTDLPIGKALKFNMYQWHKSLGVLLLIAFGVRLGWRVFHKPPPLPLRWVEAWAAKAGHVLLYICMLVVPLSGWTMVSSSVYGLPTVVFGWFAWPHIPGIAGNAWINDMARQAHWILAWFFGFCIAGHIAAVIKHIVIDHENILKRMWPVRMKHEDPSGKNRSLG